MGPGPALNAFLDEAPRSQAVIGPDGRVKAGRYDRVAVTVRDRGELRALRIPPGVRTAALAVWLDEGTSALSFTPRPEWPPLQLIRSRNVDDGWLTVLRFESPAPVNRVVLELGRQSVWPDRVGDRGLVTDFFTSEKVPRDVLLADWVTEVDSSDAEITGREPLVISQRELAGTLALGPLDERVLNPTGFDPDATDPLVDLQELDWGRGPTEAMVRRLRPALGVR